MRPRKVLNETAKIAKIIKIRAKPLIRRGKEM